VQLLCARCEVVTVRWWDEDCIRISALVILNPELGRGWYWLGQIAAIDNMRHLLSTFALLCVTTFFESTTFRQRKTSSQSWLVHNDLRYRMNPCWQRRHQLVQTLNFSPPSGCNAMVCGGFRRRKCSNDLLVVVFEIFWLDWKNLRDEWKNYPLRVTHPNDELRLVDQSRISRLDGWICNSVWSI